MGWSALGCCRWKLRTRLLRSFISSGTPIHLRMGIWLVGLLADLGASASYEAIMLPKYMFRLNKFASTILQCFLKFLLHQSKLNLGPPFKIVLANYRERFKGAVSHVTNTKFLVN
jgi:hypothetical protein